MMVWRRLKWNHYQACYGRALCITVNDNPIWDRVQQLQITHWSREKLAAILQTQLWINSLLWKMCLFLRVKNDPKQALVQKWLGAEQAANHHLNQWWSSLLITTLSNGNIFRVTGALCWVNNRYAADFRPHRAQHDVIVMWSICASLSLDGLTHWCRATHICIGNLTIIGSDNGLSPWRRQAIIWTNAEIVFIKPLGTNFSEILIGNQYFHSWKCTWKCRLHSGVHFVSASMC